MKPVALSLATLACLVCLALAWKQASYWQNGETLFGHTIAVTEPNYFAEGILGQYLMGFPGRRAEAVVHLENALRINPGYALGQNNLGLCLSEADLCSVAIPHFEQALRADSELLAAHFNWGRCLAKGGRYDEAIAHFEAALRIQPEDAVCRFNLAQTLSRMPGRELEAVAQYEAGLRSGPDDAEAHRKLGILLMSLGRKAEADVHLEIAQRLEADSETQQMTDPVGVW
jgi:tetratricopeptide (TPR) repeat protein